MYEQELLLNNLQGFCTWNIVYLSHTTPTHASTTDLMYHKGDHHVHGNTTESFITDSFLILFCPNPNE